MVLAARAAAASAGGAAVCSGGAAAAAARGKACDACAAAACTFLSPCLFFLSPFLSPVHNTTSPQQEAADVVYEALRY